MRPVCHVIACRIFNPFIQFNRAIKQHEPFCFYRHEHIDIQVGIGKQVTECGQYTKYSTAGADGCVIQTVLIKLVMFSKTLDIRKGFCGLRASR
jgi:hypothetical protein